MPRAERVAYGAAVFSFQFSVFSGRGRAAGAEPAFTAGGVATRSLVFLGSVDGLKPLPTAAAYAASKGAIAAMVRALAKELGPRGVRVNAVAPGVLDAGLTRLVPADVRREYRKHAALGRFGTCAEVARLVAWLCLDDTYVTGQSIPLDGGL